jgi:hypothetical protein
MAALSREDIVALHEAYEYLIWILLAIASLGAYAMSLSMMLSFLAKEGRRSFWVFIFPGAIYVLGYSLLGLFWGAKVWRLLASDGPIAAIREGWSDDPHGAAIVSIIWVSEWGFVLNILR